MPKALPIEQIIRNNPYGKLTVLRYGPTKKLPCGQAKRTLVCQCSCGRILDGADAPLSDNVRRKNTTQCTICANKQRAEGMFTDFSGMTIAGCKVLRKLKNVRSEEKIRWALLCSFCREEYTMQAGNLITAYGIAQDNPDYVMTCRECLDATALRPDLLPQEVELALSLRKQWKDTPLKKRTERLKFQLAQSWLPLVQPVHCHNRNKATSPDQLAGIELWLKTDQFNQERMLHRIITMLHPDFKGKTDEAERFLGCPPDHAISHIEKQFEPWMSWRNRGNANGCWNIDHIYPKSRTNRLTNSIETLACSNWKNLRPLSFEKNMAKGNKIIPGATKLFELLLEEQRSSKPFTFENFNKFIEDLN